MIFWKTKKKHYFWLIFWFRHYGSIGSPWHGLVCLSLVLILMVGWCSNFPVLDEKQDTMKKNLSVVRDLAFFSDQYDFFPQAEEKISHCQKDTYDDKIKLFSFGGLVSRDVYEKNFSFTGEVDSDIDRIEFFSQKDKNALKIFDFAGETERQFSFDLELGSWFELGSNLYLVRWYRCDGVVLEKVVELYGHWDVSEIILEQLEKSRRKNKTWFLRDHKPLESGKLWKNSVWYFFEKKGKFDEYQLGFLSRSLDKQILTLPDRRMLIYQVVKTGEENLSNFQATLMVKDVNWGGVKSSENLSIWQLWQSGQWPVLRLYDSGAFVLRTDSVFDWDGEEYFFQPQGMKLISVSGLLKKHLEDQFFPDFSVTLEDGKLIVAEYKPCCGRWGNRKLQTYFFDSLTLDYLWKK